MAQQWLSALGKQGSVPTMTTPKSRNGRFKSILFTAKVLGCFPFDEVHFRLSTSWALYSFLIVSFFSVELAFIVYYPPAQSRVSFIHSFLFNGQMIALFLCLVMFNLFLTRRRGRLAEVFRGLDSLAGLPPEKEAKLKTVLGHFSAQFLVILATGLFDYIGNSPLDDMLVFTLSYYYAIITIISSGTLPFVSILEMVCCRFEAITSRLKSFLCLSGAQYYLPDLLRFVNIYNRSVNLLSALNEVFNIQLLFISIVSFINVTTNLYNIVDFIVTTKVYESSEGQERSRLIPVYTGWIVIFSSLICFPIYSCSLSNAKVGFDGNAKIQLVASTVVVLGQIDYTRRDIARNINSSRLSEGPTMTLQRSAVTQAIEAAFLPSKILLLSPLNVYSGVYYINTKLLILSLVICIGILSSFGLLTVAKPPDPETLYLTRQIDLADGLFMMTAPLISLYDLLTNLEEMNDSLEELREVAETVGGEPGHMRRGHHWSHITDLLFTFSALISRTTKNWVYNTGGWASFLETTYYAYLMAQMSILGHRYAGLLSLPAALLEATNLQLLPKPRAIRLEELARVHHRLCLIADKISQLEMPHLFVIILASFVVFVSESYKAVSLVLNDFNSLVMVIKLSWIGASMNIVLKIVGASRRCSNKAKEFNALLYQLMIDDKTNEITNNKKLRLHISMKREVVFTACGFFNLDYTLIHSMIAAATTYLVILIQFGNGSRSPTDSPTNETLTFTTSPS